MRLKILIRSRRQFISYAIILLTSFIVVGEENENARQFDEQAMSSYSESDDFSYMNLTVRPPSIWQRLKWWFGDLIAKIFSNPNSPWLSRIIFYCLLFVVLGGAIFYMLRLKYGRAVSSESKYTSSINTGALKSTKAIDFDKLIDEAQRTKNFKLAIRYVYLKSLAFLASQELIKLKDWKSPYDYERELKSEMVPIYVGLTHLFEYVWYGDFDAGESEFERGSDLAKQLENKAK